MENSVFEKVTGSQISHSFVTKLVISSLLLLHWSTVLTRVIQTEIWPLPENTSDSLVTRHYSSSHFSSRDVIHHLTWRHTPCHVTSYSPLSRSYKAGLSTKWRWTFPLEVVSGYQSVPAWCRQARTLIAPERWGVIIESSWVNWYNLKS